MSKHKSKRRYRQRLSLATRISCLLVLAAILPLMVTVVIIEFFSSPTLVNQASNEMETDARTRTQLIDSYFSERLLSSETVSRLEAVQKFLAGDTSMEEAAREGLATGQVRGSEYQNWSLFDMQGHLRLYYPTVPQKHGAFFILPNVLQELQNSRRTLISDVFYNPISNEAYIDIYAPVVTPSYEMVGILRTTFDLHYIWSIVDDEANADGQGSYAFILDENGVCIAATNPHPDPYGMTHSPLIFKAMVPLSPALQQRIRSEQLYGSDGKSSIPVLDQPMLAAIVQGKSVPMTFQTVPPDQHSVFEVARWTTYTVPWTYFVVSPLSTVTLLADQQLQITLMVAAVVLLLAIILGIVAGTRFALPIMRSIEAQQRAYEHQQHLGELKDQFLINVSHELRTPLTELYGYLDLLLAYDDQLDSAGRKTFLKNAMSGCEELTLLINNVLDAIQIDTKVKLLQLQPVAVASVVEKVLEQFDPRTLQNYKIRVDIAPSLYVNADPQYVRQVLRNLLSNAYKYAPAHTQIVVSARLEGQMQQATEQVVICVKDQGPGIAPDEIPLLFEKFVRLERDLSGSVRGTGLGLYISKQLVEAMGGRIWVESPGVAGQGSSFCFSLPAALASEKVVGH
jgi:signal transduction histidine kinase